MTLSARRQRMITAVDRSYLFAVCAICASAYLAQTKLEEHAEHLIPTLERLDDMNNASISASGTNFWQG